MLEFVCWLLLVAMSDRFPLVFVPPSTDYADVCVYLEAAGLIFKLEPGYVISAEGVAWLREVEKAKAAKP